MLYRSVKYTRHSLDAVFAALADPTRRAIAERLAEGPASVSELAEPFGLRPRSEHNIAWGVEHVDDADARAVLAHGPVSGSLRK